MCSDVLEFRTVSGGDIYRSLASRLQRSLLESLARQPATTHELHRLQPDASAATLARSISQLIERGLVHRHGATLSLANPSTPEVLRLARCSPGGLPTLRVLANPVARALLEALLAGRRSRHELSRIASAPRVSETLKDLELLGAIQRDGHLVLLVEPLIHHGILDLVDEILEDAHLREGLQARSRIRARAALSGSPAPAPATPRQQTSISGAIPPGNLSPDTLFDFIVGDFEATWEALAATWQPGQNGGNFLFARQAMSLLELCCRVASADPTGNALAAYGAALDHIEPRYFTLLPGRVPAPRGFELPSRVGCTRPEQQLLWALFDLVRHGHAHLYQQTPVRLSDGTMFGVSLDGVERGSTLSTMTTERRHPAHLALYPEPGAIWLAVLPGALFLDLRDAARQASIFTRGLLPNYFKRPGAGRQAGTYAFAAEDLLGQLNQAGHPVLQR